MTHDWKEVPSRGRCTTSECERCGVQRLQFLQGVEYRKAGVKLSEEPPCLQPGH